MTKLFVVKLLSEGDLFKLPVPSKLVGFFFVNIHNVSDPYKIILNNIKFKFFFVQFPNNEGVVILLCHNF